MRSRAFPGTLEAATEAEAWLDGEMSALGLAEESAFAIRLCVEELFINAVKHGRATSATISISSRPGGALLEFVDDGRAFDPADAPAKRLQGSGTDFEIGGFGVGLVRKFASRMTYRRADGANHLVLEFDAGPLKTSDSRAYSAE